MSAHQAVFPIATMARVLGVSKAGYYAWLRRSPSARAVADRVLIKRIRTIHVTSHETYGVPRIHAEVRAVGEKHGRKRIARLMRAGGIVGVSRRRGAVVTTRRDKDARPEPDLVDRDFSASAPNQLWVADITFIPTAAGFLYLAVVLDAFSRRIVGWAMANHLRTELVLDALGMAIGQRQPTDVIQWDRSATRTTTPCAKASSRRSSASCWHGAGSPRRQRPEWPSSASSRAGTTRPGGIPALAISHRLLMRR